jgi:hypothetical protein
MKTSYVQVYVPIADPTGPGGMMDRYPDVDYGGRREYVLRTDYDDMFAKAAAAVWLVPPDKLVGELRDLYERVKALLPCDGCRRGLPLTSDGHHYARISNIGPLAPYYLDLQICTKDQHTS